MLFGVLLAQAIYISSLLNLCYLPVRPWGVRFCVRPKCTYANVYANACDIFCVYANVQICIHKIALRKATNKSKSLVQNILRPSLITSHCSSVLKPDATVLTFPAVTTSTASLDDDDYRPGGGYRHVIHIFPGS